MPMKERIIFRKPARLVNTKEGTPRPIQVDAGRPEAVQAFTEGMGNGR